MNCLKKETTMNRNNSSIFTSFTDMAMCLLLLFICLFALTFIFMSKKVEQSKKVDAKAEFVITIEWPKESESDVDSYLEDPAGNVAFFRAREVGLIHLDRDDLGRKNDRIELADGSLYEVKENRETLTIRGIVPGEYALNVHMYLNQEKDKNLKVPITVTMTKINPTMKVVMIKEVELHKSGDETTAFRFTLDKYGEVTDVNFLQKGIASAKNDDINEPEIGP